MWIKTFVVASLVDLTVGKMEETDWSLVLTSSMKLSNKNCKKNWKLENERIFLAGKLLGKVLGRTDVLLSTYFAAQHPYVFFSCINIFFTSCKFLANFFKKSKIWIAKKSGWLPTRQGLIEASRQKALFGSAMRKSTRAWALDMRNAEDILESGGAALMR